MITKPNFSGSWVLNLQSSRLSPTVAPKVRSGSLQVEHIEPQFTGHMVIMFEDGPINSNFSLASDGREVMTTNERGQRITSSLRWDESSLVAAWRIEGPGFEMAIAFRYELLNAGQILQATEHLRAGGGNQDNLWVFARS